MKLFIVKLGIVFRFDAEPRTVTEYVEAETETQAVYKARECHSDSIIVGDSVREATDAEWFDYYTSSDPLYGGLPFED